MATRKEPGSWWGRGWAQAMQHVKNACHIIKRIALKPLNYLFGTDSNGMRRPFDLMFRMYELNNRINGLPPRRQIIVRGMLITSCVVFSCIAIYFIGTSGGGRRAINTSISKFEYPSLPTRSRKIFFFFKIGFGICLVYNMLAYLVNMHAERVALMNRLEEDAADIIPGQSTEARLDSTVPRVGDDSKTEKARQLIAMRRLYHRGEFKFDVVPESESVRVYEPTGEDIQALRKPAELETLRRVNDPQMLREYIRRRESRKGRRRVHYGNL